MDRGAAALYTARQCHQPDPAVDLAAQRRGQGADDPGDLPLSHRQYGAVFHSLRGGNSGISGRAEAAVCPLSGGLPCQHTAGVRGNSLERPAADEAVSCKGGVP